LSCHPEAKEDATDYMKDLEKNPQLAKGGRLYNTSALPTVAKVDFSIHVNKF
jgi:hypothetical protein